MLDHSGFRPRFAGSGFEKWERSQVLWLPFRLKWLLQQFRVSASTDRIRWSQSSESPQTWSSAGCCSQEKWTHTIRIVFRSRRVKLSEEQ